MSWRDQLSSLVNAPSVRRFIKRLRGPALIVLVGFATISLMPKGDPNDPASVAEATEARRAEELRIATQALFCFTVTDEQTQRDICSPGAEVSFEEIIEAARREATRPPSPSEPQPQLFAAPVSFAEPAMQLEEQEREIVSLRRDLEAREARIAALETQAQTLEVEAARLRQRIATAMNATAQSCDADINQAVNETARAMERDHAAQNASQVCFTHAEWASERGRIDGLCSVAGFVRN